MDGINPLSTIFIYVTNSCNLKCKHCWVNAGKKLEIEISSDEIIRTINTAIKMGLRRVKVTGGEPFLRKDLLKILKYIRKKGLNLTIETNGTLLNKEIVKELEKIKPLVLAISLDGATPKVHDESKGVRGTYEKVLKAISLLKVYKIPIQIITTIQKHNMNQLEKIVKLSMELGISSHKIEAVSEMGRAIEMTNGLLEADEIYQLFKRENILMRKYGKKIVTDVPPAFRPIDLLKKYGIIKCPLNQLLTILPDGGISLCGIGQTEKDLVFGNIKENSIKEIWENNEKLNEIRNITYEKINGVCRFCIMKKYCNGFCRAYAYSKYRSLYAPYPICQLLYEKNKFPSFMLIDQSKRYSF